MTPEETFDLYRAYKFHYEGTYDFVKYRGKIKSPSLSSQQDRQYFYRLANKLTDTAIHALFTYGFFFTPKAHVSEFVTREMMSQALLWSGRLENGLPLLRADLYDTKKRLSDETLDSWLYGALHTNGTRDTMPGCVRDIIGKILPVDLACSLLLIPIPERNYAWTTFWETHSAATFQLGPFPWIERLKLFDRLLHAQSTSWRYISYTIACECWSDDSSSLAPLQPVRETALF